MWLSFPRETEYAFAAGVSLLIILVFVFFRLITDVRLSEGKSADQKRGEKIYLIILILFTLTIFSVFSDLQWILQFIFVALTAFL